MDKEMMDEIYDIMKKSGRRELSMDEMDMISGGQINEADRETFIIILAGHKQMGWDKTSIRNKFNIPDLLEVIEEVWDTL